MVTFGFFFFSFGELTILILFILVQSPHSGVRACVSGEWQSLSLCMWELIRLSVQSYLIMKSSGWDITYSVRQGLRAREVFNGSSAQQQEIMTIWQTSVRTDIHPFERVPFLWIPQHMLLEMHQPPHFIVSCSVYPLPRHTPISFDRAWQPFLGTRLPVYC
jgi:hypothetical protein